MREHHWTPVKLVSEPDVTLPLKLVKVLVSGVKVKPVFAGVIV